MGDLLQNGKKNQIDSWTNPQNADIATLSIGGNDLGFVDILDACVLRVEQNFSGTCDELVNAAHEKINGFDLFNDITSALQ